MKNNVIVSKDSGLLIYISYAYIRMIYHDLIKENVSFADDTFVYLSDRTISSVSTQLLQHWQCKI